LAFSARPPWRRFRRDDGCRLRGSSHSGTPRGRVDQWPFAPGLRLSLGDAFQLARSVAFPGASAPGRSLPHGGVDAGLLSWGCHRSPLHRLQCLASTPGAAWPPGSFRRTSLRAVPDGASVPRDVYTRGRSVRHRPGVATLRTRSALAVLPGFDGLLRLTPCRFVAPCCRSWGSPRFRSWAMPVFGLLAEPSAARSASVPLRAPLPA
jgi:hypothetical protein